MRPFGPITMRGATHLGPAGDSRYPTVGVPGRIGTSSVARTRSSPWTLSSVPVHWQSIDGKAESKSLFERNARCECGGRSRGGIGHGRVAQSGHADVGAAYRRFELERVAPLGQEVCVGRTDVRGRDAARIADDATAATLGLLARERIVSICHRDAILRKGGVEVALLSCDLLATTEELDVRAADVRYECHVRASDRRETGDLAAMVHSELDDSTFVDGFAAQEGEREAEFVVQIALGLQARARRS